MIIAAAIMHKGILYQLPIPARHHDIIHMIHTTVGKYVRSESVQGFIDDKQGFVNRILGGLIALDEGQIKELYAPPELFSEDLW